MCTCGGHSARGVDDRESFPLSMPSGLLAGAREENRLDMIDRRRPRPWTQLQTDEIITEALLTIVGKCGLLAGYRGEKVPAPVCPLTEARSRLRVGYEVLSDRTRLILTKR